LDLDVQSKVLRFTSEVKAGSVVGEVFGSIVDVDDEQYDAARNSNRLLTFQNYQDVNELPISLIPSKACYACYYKVTDEKSLANIKLVESVRAELEPGILNVVVSRKSTIGEELVLYNTANSDDDDSEEEEVGSEEEEVGSEEEEVESEEEVVDPEAKEVNLGGESEEEEGARHKRRRVDS
jgi:hypothetical protein